MPKRKARGPYKRHNWHALKYDFIHGAYLGLPDFAAANGISLGLVKRHSAKEGWIAARKLYREKAQIEQVMLKRDGIHREAQVRAAEASRAERDQLDKERRQLDIALKGVLMTCVGDAMNWAANKNRRKLSPGANITLAKEISQLRQMINFGVNQVIRHEHEVSGGVDMRIDARYVFGIDIDLSDPRIKPLRDAFLQVLEEVRPGGKSPVSDDTYTLPASAVKALPMVPDEAIKRMAEITAELATEEAS